MRGAAVEPIEEPKPQTTREYLIRIYDEVRNVRQEVASVRQCIIDHERRIKALEESRSQAQGERGILGVIADKALAAMLALAAGFLGGQIQR